MKAGIVLHVGQNHYCKIVIRGPGLGGRALQNMGGVCEADSITRLGRVAESQEEAKAPITK